MAKQKERSELEHLRSVNKTLKSEIKHLKKEIARYNKRAHRYDDLEEREADEQLEEQVKETLVPATKTSCPECSAVTETSEIGNRVLVRCTNCKWRKSQKL